MEKHFGITTLISINTKGNIMNKINKELMKAFDQKKEIKLSNSEIINKTGTTINNIVSTTLFYHGNPILFKTTYGVYRGTFHGWKTNTTKSRINAFFEYKDTLSFFRVKKGQLVFENYAPALEDWITYELDPRDEFTFRIDKGLDPIKPFVYNFVTQKPPYLTIPKYAHEENIKQTKENRKLGLLSNTQGYTQDWQFAYTPEKPYFKKMLNA